MIGAVIVTHGGIGRSLVEAAESISGPVENARCMSVGRGDSTEKIREELSRLIKEVDSGRGVIIFTDMFGGTPTNIALSFLEAGRVEVLTGVNLPVLLKFINHRLERPLEELAEALKEYGRTSIVHAGDMLKEKK